MRISKAVLKGRPVCRLGAVSVGWLGRDRGPRCGSERLLQKKLMTRESGEVGIGALGLRPFPDRQRDGDNGLVPESARASLERKRIMESKEKKQRVKEINEAWNRGEREALKSSSNSQENAAKKNANLTKTVEDSVELKPQKRGPLSKVRTTFSKKVTSQDSSVKFAVCFLSKLSLLRCVREIKNVLRELQMEFSFDRQTSKLRVIANVRGHKLISTIRFDWAEGKTMTRMEIKQAKDDPGEVDWKGFTAFYKAVMVEFKKVGPDAIVRVQPSRDSRELS